MSYILVTLCCTFAALGSFLFGYDSGVISSSIEQDAFLDYFGSPGLSDAASGGIISSYTGAPVLGHLSSTLALPPLSSDHCLILTNRRCNHRISSSTVHLRFLWTSNGNLHWRIASHAGRGTTGWFSHRRDADRWSIHRGLRYWTHVSYDSRLLCMFITFEMRFGSSNLFPSRADLNKERGCTATHSWLTCQYAAVDDWAWYHGGCKLLFPLL